MPSPHEFSEDNRSLSSFVNLLMMLLGFDETKPDFDWSSYLKCISLMPGAGFKPGHPFCLPLGFRPEGPPKLLPLETVEAVEQRFAALRALRRQIDEAGVNAQSDLALLRVIGPEAMATVRALGGDLEAHRFPSGESYVLGLIMRQSIPPDEVEGARLIQILDDFADVPGCDAPGAKRLSTRLDLLIYRLPDAGAAGAFAPARRQTWRDVGRRLEQTFAELFPSNYALVEIRDCDAATIYRGKVLGPTFQDLQRQKEQRQRAAEDG